MALRKVFSSQFLPLLGGMLLIAAWFAADAGSVIPILGVLVALLAPNLFLAGIALYALWAARLLTPSKNSALILALVFTILLGFNTRIPTFFSDILQRDADNLMVVEELGGAVGQPIHIVAESDLQARQRPYASAEPACYGDGCIATKGFRTKNPGIEADYWHQRVTDVVLTAGFVKANPGETAPTLVVKPHSGKHVSTVQIELSDANGKVLSKYKGRYRNGFPFETNDGVGALEPGESLRRLEYLLHGSTLNKLGAGFIPNGKPYPLTVFLEAASSLAHPQGSKLGLASRMSRQGSEPATNAMALEILYDKVYEPAWKPKEMPHPNGYASQWQGMPTWDKERDDRCKTLLRPEIDAPVTQTWYLFVNDPSGRKKVRISSINAFCDPDALWFLDYVAEQGNVVITKYRINGDLAYRLSFKKPSPIYGYMGSIPVSTFKAEGGYIRFEWWELNHSASRGMEVKRVMKAQLKEPTPTL